MGKNYVENSLKRFLKRKVKITLGVVVTFLITGIVSFGAEGTVTVGEYQKDYIEAVESLKGLGTGVISAEKNKDIIIEKTADKTIIKKAEDKSVIVEIDNSLISTKTAETVSTALNSTETKEGINNGILEKKQETSASIKKIINNGVIKNSGEGQYTNIKDTQIINNGVIICGHGQKVESEKGTIINSGLIQVQGTGQILYDVLSESTAKNTGVITTTYGIGQSIEFGTNKKNIKLENYGKIIANQGQSITGTNNFAKNYGIINAMSAGQIGNGIFYNYGLINSKKIGMNVKNQETAKGYNYGVIEVADATNAFNGDVINKGIVIADKGKLTDQYNTGIFLDSEYNLRGEDTKEFKSGETITAFEGINEFGENITKGYVKDASVNIDNTQGKVIGAVVTKDSTLNEAVLKYEGKDLFLKDTTITGYFEKEGTLLDVGTGNLTLGGDTNITAVKGDLSLDVTAVKLGDKGKVTIIGDAKINGKIEGGTGTIHFADSKGVYNVESGNVEIGITGGNTESDYQKYFDVTLTSTTPDKDNQTSGENINYIKLSTENAVVDLKNTLVIDSSVTVGKDDKEYSIYDTNTTNENAELELTIENINNIKGNISLGVGKDTVIVNNTDNADHTMKEINLGAGEDKFVVNGYAKDDKGNSSNVFNYNVVNAETIELRGGTWGDWSEAKGTIKFEGNKAGNKPILRLGNDTIMHITLNAEKDHGSDFADYVANDLKLSHAVITGTGKESVAKYQIDETNGLDTGKLSTTKYSFGEGVSYKDSPIFNISSEEGTGVNISLKTAADLGLSSQQRVIYDAYIKQIIADGSVNKGVINKINNMNNQNDMVNLIKKTDVNGRAYYTAGSVVTKDIVNSYVSSVEEFKPRAEKGQWLAQGKYINSDTEFDGGSKVKGYDGDITGTVGMIEYGFTDNTSYGAVFGQGDAEMDINGGGKLDGDNIYAGLYMKHRTANGIELVGNIGYGLRVDNGAKAIFSKKVKGIKILNQTEDYTSQTLTAKEGTEIAFNNAGDVDISSKSGYGVTAVDNQGGKITFNNTGDVNIYGEILPGKTTAKTNVVGIQSGTSGSVTTVTDKVNNFNITLKGAGVDDDGTTYSTGTKAVTMENGSKFSSDSKTFNIKMDIASDVQDDSPEGHASSLAYGLYTNNGSINVGENTLTDINISQGIGKGYAVYSEGKNSKIDILGDTVINVAGKNGAFGVSAKNGATINTTGKNISIIAKSLEGNATAVEINNYIKTENDVKKYGIAGETINLGGANTENIVLKATGKEFATGIEVVNHNTNTNGETKLAGSKVEVKSKNLNIDVHSTSQEAAGIWVQNSTSGKTPADKIANVIIDSENMVINVTSDTKGKALGLVNMSQGRLEINGNLEVNAEIALDTRGEAVTVINKDGKNTVRLNGDIVFDYDDKTSKTTIDADVTINLSNAESYFNGNIGTASDINPIPEDKKDVFGMKLGLSNGAQWTTDANSFVNKLTLDGGIININGGEEQTVKVDELIGTGGAINMTAEIGDDGTATSGELNIGKVENKNARFAVNYKGTDNLEVDKDKAETVFKELAENIKVKDGKFNADAKLEEGFVSREYTSEFVKDEKGNIVVKEDSVKIGNLNSMVEGIRDLATINLLTWRQEMNSLNKRMGELRNSTGEHGVWSRVYTGKIENGSKYDNDYQTYQVGYDKKYTVDNGVMFVGRLVSYTDGETDYALGHGENYSVGAGIYATWLNNDGQFADVVLKQSRLHNKFDVTSKNGNKSQSGDYNNWGTSLSGQYGKRFDLNDKFFLEPSVELTLGRVDDTTYTTSTGVDVHQDTMYSLVGNVGTSVGYKFSDKGNVYARAALVKEFQGDIDTEYEKDGALERTSEDLGDTWAEFGVGVNYRFVENMNVYIDVQKTGEATVDNKWQANLGFRYEF